MAGVVVTRALDTEETATAQNYLEQYPVDQIFNGNLLLGMLMDGKPPGVGEFRDPEGRRRKETGGIRIAIPVAYNRSSNVVSFRGNTDIPLNIDEVATECFTKWSYYVGSAVILKTESWENRSPHKRYDLLEARLKMMLMTMKETIDAHLYANGDGVAVGNNGKDIIGLDHLLSDDPTTGTVWGIPRDTYTWWRHNYEDAGALFSAVGLDKLTSWYNLMSGTNGEDPHTLWLTTPAMWEAYEKQVRDVQRIVTTTVGDRGYPTLQHMGLPIFRSNLVPANTWYGLNMNYAVIVEQEGVDFALEQAMPPANQPIDKIWQVYFSAQFGFERYDRQGRFEFSGV